ncbi:MAG: helix-turn-helix domain-containing protein [Lactobacillales bacterium]|nr:helix-turn-helix domain-containing protein [Lactobacillales bacterium]
MNKKFDKELLQNIGMRIAFARKDIGMKQSELGAASGKMLNTISNIERGKVDAKITTFSAIARALKVPLSEFLTIDDESFLKDEEVQIFVETARTLRRMDRNALIIARGLIKSLFENSKVISEGKIVK